MKTHTQLVLFDGFEPQTALAPKLELPIQRSKQIDIRRTCQILGINHKTARRLLENGMIRGFRHTAGISPWHIDYDSVVEYCDQLRVLHCISDHRVGLTGTRKRHRDRDLLPFPLDETIYMAEARQRLDLTTSGVVHLIEAGALTGYQVVFEMPGCPWRIHAPSLERYIASLRAMTAKRPSVHTAPASR